MKGITRERGMSFRRIQRLLPAGLALVVCLVVSGAASAQDGVSDVSGFLTKPERATSAPVNKTIARLPNLVKSPSTVAAGTTRVITLEEAQAAAAGQNPMVRLGQLQVEAAKQNRQIFAANYLPQVSATFTNLHFNKFMGEQISVRRPILGTTIPIALPLLGKDQTLAAFTVMQPLTPLLKVQQAVKIARADENIARAKAGMPVTETSRNVEKNYFDLLIAQRELTVAQIKSARVQEKFLLASNAPPPRLSPEQEATLLEAEQELILARGKARELTASLNFLLGLPEETELELVHPAMPVENLSLVEATQKALESNPEVIEAEQTAIKARAGRRLAKLDYVPDVVVLGGYAYQNNMVPLLPRDFSFIGVMATYSIFDGGKREHTVKMRHAQVEAAELAVELTKAKVSAAIKTSYFEVERSRSLSELSERMMSAGQVVNAGYRADSSEVKEARTTMEAEMFRAELAYREALGRLKTLMGR